MKKLLAITFLLISNIGFSQLNSVIIDRETREKIAYVNIWIENENTGTTSNEKGEFELKVDSPKIIVFSAIGFETKKIPSDSIKSNIELKPIITELNEVVIKPKNLTEKLIIGKFKKSKINLYYSGGTTPWIIARYFEYKEEYQKTDFLNKIKFLTNSDLKDSKFNIRLYGKNEKGEPEGYIYDENIIGIAKKGKNITEIDISNLNIRFPKEGFFIAIEWLIIEDNKHEFSYPMQGSRKKSIGITYEPKIGTVPAETAENSWIFLRGKWGKVWKNKTVSEKYDYSKRYRNKYNLIAIELTLTD